MVNNNLCEKCNHAYFCIFCKFVEKFSDEAKHPIGIDITMDKCSSYEETE